MAAIPIPAYNCDLPSKGLLYDGKLPEGRVEVRAMRTGEEAVIFSQGEDFGTRVNSIFNSCIITKTVPVEDLLMVDRMAILMAIRLHSFGGEYSFNHRCDLCGTQFKHTCDLGKDINVDYMGEDEEGNPINIAEPFYVDLPDSKVRLGYRLLRGRDEMAISRHVKRIRMQNSDPADPAHKFAMATKMLSIDGREVKMLEASKIVTEMTIRDSRAFQIHTDKIERGVDRKILIDCRGCGGTNEVFLPFSLEFFRPASV